MNPCEHYPKLKDGMCAECYVKYVMGRMKMLEDANEAWREDNALNISMVDKLKYLVVRHQNTEIDLRRKIAAMKADKGRTP